MWKPLACALMTLSSATAATIIGATEYPGSGRGGTTGGSTLAVQFSFALSEAYTNVRISADLDPHPSGNGLAFLTRTSGPGTTDADEVASAHYNFVGSTHAWTSVLYLPHLSAGSYFLPSAPMNSVLGSVRYPIP